VLQENVFVPTISIHISSESLCTFFDGLTDAFLRKASWMSHWRWYGKIYPGNASTRPSKTLRRNSKLVWVLMVDTLNTSIWSTIKCFSIKNIWNLTIQRFYSVTRFWFIKKQGVDSLKVAELLFYFKFFGEIWPLFVYMSCL
jgi:hypothetical protein